MEGGGTAGWWRGNKGVLGIDCRTVKRYDCMVGERPTAWRWRARMQGHEEVRLQGGGGVDCRAVEG